MSKCRGPPFLCLKSRKRVKKGGTKDARQRKIRLC